MSLMPAVNQALAGIQSNLWSLNDVASRLAKPDDEAINLVPELVEAEEAKQAVLANAKVAATADEMLGSLIDILA